MSFQIVRIVSFKSQLNFCNSRNAAATMHRMNFNYIASNNVPKSNIFEHKPSSALIENKDILNRPIHVPYF